MKRMTTQSFFAMQMMHWKLYISKNSKPMPISLLYSSSVDGVISNQQSRAKIEDLNATMAVT